jgi:hypothetical protein
MDTTVGMIRKQIQGQEIRVRSLTVNKFRQKSNNNKVTPPYLHKQVGQHTTKWLLCYNIGSPRNSHVLMTWITDNERAS